MIKKILSETKIDDVACKLDPGIVYEITIYGKKVYLKKGSPEPMAFRKGGRGEKYKGLNVDERGEYIYGKNVEGDEIPVGLITVEEINGDMYGIVNAFEPFVED